VAFDAVKSEYDNSSSMVIMMVVEVVLFPFSFSLKA
jgi:hypothetical protein